MPHPEYARMLLAAHRPVEAERAAREGLGQDPRNRDLLHILCSALAEQEKLAEARAAAADLVALEPNWVNAHLILSVIEIEDERYGEAEKAALEARRLAPHSASPRNNLSLCYLKQKRWEEALREAEAGLALDPDNSGCANVRALALNHLGRRIESLHSTESALRRNPQSSYTHYTAGFVQLQAGDHQQAEEHFTEALRLDPTNEAARKGLVEAMKARNPVYRALLSYSFWMMRLTGLERRAVIIGGVIAYNVLEAIPGLGVISIIIMIAWVGFVMLTWVGSPLFNFLLLLDRRARHALDARQKAAAIALIGCLIASVGWAGLALTMRVADPFWSLAILLFAIPLTRVFRKRRGWRRWAGFVVTAGLGLWLLLGIITAVLTLDEDLLLPVLISLVLYMWVGRFLDK